MKIYLGADHNGFALKEQVEQYLLSRGYQVADDGDFVLDPDDDFTVYAAKVVRDVLSSDDAEPRGILLCGSGQGMVIAANRFKGIRAGLGWSSHAARSIRNDEDSNVLALPAQVLLEDAQWQEIIEIWLQTPFANAPRYRRRNAQLDTL